MNSNPSGINFTKVQSDNWTNNNGNGDVDARVMEDLGFTTWQDLTDVVKSGQDLDKSERPQNLRVAEAAGKIVCGDCGSVFPCPHGTGSNTIGN